MMSLPVFFVFLVVATRAPSCAPTVSTFVLQHLPGNPCGEALGKAKTFLDTVDG